MAALLSLPAACPRRVQRPAAGAPPDVQPARTARSVPGFTRAAFPLLDVHTHLDPEATDLIVPLFDARNIRVAVNLSGGTPGMGLEESMAQGRATGDRIIPFCTLSWHDSDTADFVTRAVATLEQCHSLGIRGLKIPKVLGLYARDLDGSRLRVDAPRLDPIFEACGRLGMVILIHAGDPRAFFEPATPANERWEELGSHPRWSFADRTRFPTFDGIMTEFENRVLRHPGTTFIGAHFGNDAEEPERVARLLERAPNYYIDTAARVPEFGRHPAGAMRSFFLRWRDRILFGTDLQLGRDVRLWGLGSRGDADTTQRDIERFFSATFRFFESNDQAIENPTPIQGRWPINSIGLPDDVLAAVYGGNAARLLHIRWPQ